MKPRSGASPPNQLPTIGIGTGANERLVDPGAARALSFAAEELGYSSVWTFDSPAGERWTDPRPGRDVDDVLATLETFVSSTSGITVGAALLRAHWPLPVAVVERLIATQEASLGRLVVARPYSSALQGVPFGPMYQMWSPEEPQLAPWATGWMVDRWEHAMPRPDFRAARGGLVVRLPVHDAAEQLVAEIHALHAIGASEVVLDVVADDGIDQALSLYSRIAEQVEGNLDRRTA